MSSSSSSGGSNSSSSSSSTNNGLTPMQCFARDCQALLKYQQVLAVEFSTHRQVPLEQVLGLG